MDFRPSRAMLGVPRFGKQPDKHGWNINSWGARTLFNHQTQQFARLVSYEAALCRESRSYSSGSTAGTLDSTRSNFSRLPRADVTVRIQNGHLLGQGRRDELVERNAVVVSKRLRAAVKRFRNVDVERAHDAERILRKWSGVAARIPRASTPGKSRRLCVMMNGALAAKASSRTKGPARHRFAARGEATLAQSRRRQ